MGFCCSKVALVAYKWEKYLNEDAWLQWDKHEARKHYRIERVLGRGAFSEVVAAVSKETGRRVALKVVFLDNPGLQQQHADVLQAEVTIMKKLSEPKHANIVSFENIIHDPIRKQLVIAEEILLGGTLTDELLHGSNCNNDRLVAHIFKQIFSALEHVHSKNIVHRDLKPENVMFRAPASRWSKMGAVPVLIDFGMSQELNQGGPPIRGLLGSPGFVAPEVIDGGPHSSAQDMFAVGVMLYITITGRRPMTNRQANTLTYSKFEAWDYPHMHSDAVWIAANSSAKDIVMSLLERDPSRRLTAAEAQKHPWVTDDMKVQRPIAAASAAQTVKGQDAVLAEKRCRLTQERHQGHVEEMLHYMVLALQARNLQGAAAVARKGSVQAHSNTRGFRSANPSLMATPSMLSDIRVHLPEMQDCADIVATGGSNTSSELTTPRDANTANTSAQSQGDSKQKGLATPGTPQRSPSPDQRHSNTIHGAAGGVIAATPFDGSITSLRQQRIQRWHSDITSDARAKKGMQMAADAAAQALSTEQALVGAQGGLESPRGAETRADGGSGSSPSPAAGSALNSNVQQPAPAIDDMGSSPMVLTAPSPATGDIVEETLNEHLVLVRRSLEGVMDLNQPDSDCRAASGVSNGVETASPRTAASGVTSRATSGAETGPCYPARSPQPPCTTEVTPTRAAAAASGQGTSPCTSRPPTLTASGLLPPKPQSKPPLSDSIRALSSWQSRKGSMSQNSSPRQARTFSTHVGRAAPTNAPPSSLSPASLSKQSSGISHASSADPADLTARHQTREESDYVSADSRDARQSSEPCSAALAVDDRNTEEFSEIPVQPRLSLPTLEDKDCSTLPVENFPLIQGQGDRLFDVVMHAQEQMHAAQNRKRGSTFFTPSRTPSRQNSCRLSASEDRCIAQTSSALQLRVSGSPCGTSVAAAGGTALFGTSSFDSPADSAQVPLLGGGDSAARASSATNFSGARALVRGASGPCAAPASLASAPSATEVEVGGLVGLWGAAGAEAMGNMQPSPHEGMDLHDVRAVAQVQWGLRRWRQLAGHLHREGPAPHIHGVASSIGVPQRRRSSSAEPRHEAPDAILADLVSPGMRRAQEDAEKALRIGTASPASAALRRSFGTNSVAPCVGSTAVGAPPILLTSAPTQ